MPEPLLGNECGNWNPPGLFGLLLFSFNWISLYSANNEFLSYDHFAFSFCLVSVQALLSTLRVLNGTKLKVYKYFCIVFLRSVVLLFYPQIMPCGTYLATPK